MKRKYEEVEKISSTINCNEETQKLVASSASLPQDVLATPSFKKPHGIFLNTAEAKCSIYESGKMAYYSLLLSSRYELDYLEIDQNLHHLPDKYDFYVFNYHHVTMGWLNTKNINQLSGIKLTLVLETLTNNPFVLCPAKDFDAYCTLDPTMKVIDKRVYAFPRPLDASNTVIPYDQLEIPVIGTFGFATPGKGFELVVDAVNKEFDEAIVKINIPSATYADASTWKLHKQNYANYLSKLCRKVARKGIEVIVSHDYMTKDELIKWCSQNTLNCFLYNRSQPGLSATTDQAISSGRPLAISTNETFRHIHSYVKPYPFQSLRESIAVSQSQVLQMQQDWTPKNFALKFEKVLEEFGLLLKNKREQVQERDNSPIEVINYEKKSILIVSHKEKQCGIYQYGINIAEALQKSSRYLFTYVECSNQEELNQAVIKTNPVAIIYNYYPATMPWLTSKITRRYSTLQLGIMHEVTQEEADKATRELFDYHLCPDPTLIENNPFVFKTRRLILPYINSQDIPDIVTIGSFGFGFSDKGFERLVRAVQDEFQQAKIVLHLPSNNIVGQAIITDIIATANRCRSAIYKPGIQLVINHEFLSKQQLLNFLASNTLNAFFYDTHKHRGISSVIDHALAVQRPIAITKCGMFRHVLSANSSICIEESSLTQIINNGVAPLVPFYNEWNESNFILSYERIIDKILGEELVCTNKSIQINSPHLLAVSPSFAVSQIREKKQSTLSSNSVKASVLFINYKVENCGVYQYGKNLFEAINRSKEYSFYYTEVANIEELDACVLRGNFNAIIYNYHPQTLKFINPYMPRRYEQVNIAVMHEMTQAEADSIPSSFFQYYIMGDPTLIENNPVIFKTGRLIVPYVNTKKVPEIVTIGTFGFSVGSKGYQKLIDVVQSEFDEAIIRIHIPSNGIVDPDGHDAHQHIKLCQQRIKKPGISIQASHQFLNRDAMLDFLAENTLNAFLYDHLEVAGISSSTDHALAVQRPIAITKSIMFRHLLSLNPSITVEDKSLKQIIRNGIVPFKHLYKLWSEQSMLQEYESILDKVLNIDKPIQFKVNKRFNRILDNQARTQYKTVIEKLFTLVPEMMKLKIPEANVQQAFVLDAVEEFASQFASPRILCIGSHEDTAAASLKKLNYQIQEIDPVINQFDLDTFFHLPSTIKGSYDIILSTSVIEHVQDDELFVTQIAYLLAPGGIAVLTCDYNDQHQPGDPIIQGDYRFYTQKDLVLRILPLLKDCSLVDVPHWDCPNPDFVFAGYRYTFATLVFQKNMIEETISGTDKVSVRAGLSVPQVGSKHNDLVIQANWDTMSVLEQRTFFSENGFLVVPNAISANELVRMYSDIQEYGFTGTLEDFWAAPSFAMLISNSKVLTALRGILGLEVRFFKGAYVATPPVGLLGTQLQRQALHVDYGIGESIEDFRNSCTSWINVGYYLTDLTSEHGPFWVVPGSNRNYHLTPGTDMEYMADQAKMVLVNAGDSIFFHCSTVHAAGVNVSDCTRQTLFFSYRPAWARPVGLVPEWPKEFVDNAPPERRRLLLGLNQGL